MATVLELKRKRLETSQAARALVAKAEGEDRKLSDEERNTLLGLKTEIGNLDERIQTLGETEALMASVGRSQAEPTRPDLRPEQGNGHGPFASLGEQLVAVYQAARNPGNVDPRLLALNGAGESGTSGEGFMVQQEFTREALVRMYGSGEIMSRVRRRRVGANFNGIKINVLKEISRANGSRWGGIRMYWLAEGGTKLATKPAYRRFSLDLEKLAGLYVATDELLQDTTALEEEVGEQFTQELIFTCEDAVFRGDGAGKPLGLLSAPALVTVAKEAGQAADTIVEENLRKMWSRLWAPSRANAVWLVNQEAEEQLDGIVSAYGAGAMPSRIVRYNEDGSIMTIKGRPVIFVEYASALGDLGDIVLADLNEYRWIDKTDVQKAASIHVYFTTDETAFRFVYRCNGAHFWESALTPYKGANDLSAVVTLAARA